MEMRFEKKEFEVGYDSKRTTLAGMLEVVRGLGFKPSIKANPRPGKGSIPDTKGYGALLSRVVKDGRVNYARLQKERRVLDDYLAGVASVNLTKADKRTKLAFYINAYNAATLSLVLKHVKGKSPKGADVGSVQEVKGFFKKKEIRVGKKLLSLDELEALGRRLGDPRIHFAVNCAAVSCPVLLGRAWTQATLDRDLDAATKSYLASVHGFQIKAGQVYVSALFSWYKADFGGEKGIRAFLLRHGPKAAKESLDKDLAFLDYDWKLNKQR